MSDTIPFSEAKAHLSLLADRVENEHERVLVTRNGRPSFVLISPDDLDSLEESLDIVRDRDLVASSSARAKKRHKDNGGVCAT